MTHEQREEMILSNLKLVYVVAKYYKVHPSSYYTKEDIIQEGILGLIDAVDHYDESRGFSFSTYACSMIRGYILTFLGKNVGSFRYPRKSQLLLVSYYRKEEASLPNQEEYEVLSSLTPLRLDSMPLGEDSETLYSITPSTEDVSSYEKELILKESIEKALQEFKERDQKIINDYIYGRLYGYYTTQAILARRYQLSRTMLSRILNKFLHILIEEIEEN